MKKSFISIALAGILAISFSGCVGSSTPINIYQPQKENITLSGTKEGVIINGAIQLKDGSKIFDSEGDILVSFIINDELFYLIKTYIKDIPSYKIKNGSKVVIKEFRANAVKWFVDDNKFAIAEKLEKNETITVYDNIYEFNGKEFKQVNKNINLGPDVYVTNGYVFDIDKYSSGMYSIESYFSRIPGPITNRPMMYKQTIKNIITGKEIDMSSIRTNYEKGGNSKVITLGIKNDIVYYIYESSGIIFTEDYIIEALDLKNNKTYTLYSSKIAGGETKQFQLLKANNQVVLKIFDNPKLKHELWKTVNSITQYSNEPAKIISLNTLSVVDNLSNEFSTILIDPNGQYTYITCDAINVYQSLHRTGKPLF
ncbi:hypothetical protein [Aliarcobacter cryaerophilus]|uniref:hypothetical protein n=1 Tax=Aliarcobacter cryaerophilus TaxID=28198 RepID=UPI0021B6D71A|nr:hypothetical protein [Aliarcobacter cryaerophilus]MCT7545706.1 hypothetical protein [Aliarcobacter cryaerophilus]